MGIADRLRSLVRSDPTLSIDEWASWFNYNANVYGFPLGLNQTQPGQAQEEIDDTFRSLSTQAYRSNGVVFACMLVRQLLFSEARFMFRQRRNGRPGDLFSKPELSVLSRPWPNGTTGDLLTRAIQDADLAGNFFAVRRPGRIRRMRPDWVTIVLGSTSDIGGDNKDRTVAWDLDAEVVGYIYHPGGRHSGAESIPLLAENVAHFAPIPDPLAGYRGMSWLTPIVREVMGDSAARDHKLHFFEHGATPNVVVKAPPGLANDKFKDWVRDFSKALPAGQQAYKTLYLDAQTEIEVVGANLRQMDFKLTQGAGETRIAAAAGVPPVIVGLSEGLQAATYSNYGQARRRFADGTMRPLWRSIAASLSTLITVPSDAELWYDDRDIPFLAEDKKDAAEVHALEAQQIRTLTDGGFTPESIVDAVTSGDFKRLSHTGLYSVQLQPPVDPNATPVIVGPANQAQLPATTNSKRSWDNEDVALLLASQERVITFNMPEQQAPVVNFNEGAFRTGDTHIATPEVRVDAPVNIHEGAVRLEAPITVEPAQLTLAEGAIRSETHIEPTQVTIADGAVRVESPVTVEPTTVTVEPASISFPEPRASRKTVKRDAKGQITEITED